MLTKNRLKYYSSLLNKKERQSENKFLVEGRKLLYEALNSSYECEVIFALNQFVEDQYDFIEYAEHKGAHIEIIKSQELNKITDTQTPQGAVGVFLFPRRTENLMENESLIAALENISDPGNAGTIFRNCDWFGVKNILLNNECAETYNPKVIRASAGSVFHLNILKEDDFYGSLEKMKSRGYKILCADLNGVNLYDYKKNEKEIIVFCNEANGPSDILLSITDQKITIPKIGEAEYLNVASASAVILAELIRK